MSKKLIFSGCSFTLGAGWKDMGSPEESIKNFDKNSPYLWVNLCHDNIERLKKLEMINLGQGGASNTEIFQNTIRAISNFSDQIDIIFCQWTSMPRYNWNVGFELWGTNEKMQLDSCPYKHDVNLNRGDHWPREYIDDLINRLRVLHHLHWEILKIVDYSNIITRLAEKTNIQNVFFINGICPWDSNYFVELDNVLPEEYTEFTKKDILNIDTRDDEDIFKLYKLAHQHYREYGGIDGSKWINLYDSFLKNQIDVNFDNSHPGIESNKIYYNMIKTRLKELNFI